MNAKIGVVDMSRSKPIVGGATATLMFRQIVIIPNPDPANSAPKVSGGMEFTIGGIRAAAIPKQMTRAVIQIPEDKMIAA